MAEFRLLQKYSSGYSSGAVSMVELKSFCKIFDKIVPCIGFYSRSRLEPRFVAPPLWRKPEEAPGVALCLELLRNEPFDGAPAGVSFGAPPNRPILVRGAHCLTSVV